MLPTFAHLWPEVSKAQMCVLATREKKSCFCCRRRSVDSSDGHHVSIPVGEPELYSLCDLMSTAAVKHTTRV